MLSNQMFKLKIRILRLHSIPLLLFMMATLKFMKVNEEIQLTKALNTFPEQSIISVECGYGKYTIISGLIPGTSDIYKDVSYDILLNMFFVNLVNLGAKCSVRKVNLKLKEKRHIKIKMIEIYLNEKNINYLYWSDIDVLHTTLAFLKDPQKQCVLSASIEDKLIPDDHFKMRHGLRHKYMSGNLLIQSNSQSKEFIKKWIELTYLTGGILDDQWAFEDLSTNNNMICNNQFMTYKHGSNAIHLVSEHKIKLAKSILHGNTQLIKISSLIARFKNQLNSEACNNTFTNDSHGCFVLTKSSSNHDCDIYNDDRLNELFDKCVTFQPFTRKIQQIDFSRYLLGYKRGGWYFDNDITIAKDLPTSAGKELILSIEEDLNKKVLFVICQWAFYSKKNNKYFLELMLDILSERFTYNKVFLPTSWLTGPMRFTKVIGKYADEPDILLLKTGTFTNDTLIHNYEGSWLSDESWDDLSL